MTLSWKKACWVFKPARYFSHDINMCSTKIIRSIVLLYNKERRLEMTSDQGVHLSVQVNTLLLNVKLVLSP